jgi:hypothetical protein
MCQAGKIRFGLFFIVVMGCSSQQYTSAPESKYILQSNFTVEQMEFCGGRQLKDTMAIKDTKFDLIICTRGQKNTVDHYFIQDSVPCKSQFNLTKDNLHLISHTQTSVDAISVNYEMSSGFYEVMWDGIAYDRYTKDISLFIRDSLISRVYYSSVPFSNKDIPQFTETILLNDLITSCEKSFESIPRPK